MDIKQLTKIMIQIDAVLSHFEVIDFDYNGNRTIVKANSDEFMDMYNKLYGIKNCNLCIKQINYTEQLELVEIEWTDETNEITNDDIEEAYKELKPEWDQDHIDMLKEYFMGD